MSISMFIKRSDGTEQDHFVWSQKTGVDFISRLARDYGFRILNGRYPVWVEEEDLNQLLHELAIIREVDNGRLEAAGQTNENMTMLDHRWAALLDALEPLRQERGWELSFG